MYFKKSENIARHALEIGCVPDDVRILDDYLAGRHRKSFTLFDAESKTGLGCCTEPLLNEYVQEGILREPKARHLCPLHTISLEIISADEGKCIDCDDIHLLSDCEKEMVYERIKPPDNSPVPAGTTQITHPTVTEEQQSFLQRVTSFIFENAVFIFRALLIAGLSAWLIPRIFSPSEQPTTTPLTSSNPVTPITASPTAAVSATISGSLLQQESSATLMSPQTPTGLTKSIHTPLPTE